MRPGITADRSDPDDRYSLPHHSSPVILRARNEVRSS
jgi:hypothetical protein